MLHFKQLQNPSLMFWKIWPKSPTTNPLTKQTFTLVLLIFYSICFYIKIERMTRRADVSVKAILVCLSFFLTRKSQILQNDLKIPARPQSYDSSLRYWQKENAQIFSSFSSLYHAENVAWHWYVLSQCSLSQAVYHKEYINPLSRKKNITVSQAICAVPCSLTQNRKSWGAETKNFP